MESDFVRAARAECLDRLRRLREEAEAKCLFTVAGRVEALSEEIAAMRTLADNGGEAALAGRGARRRDAGVSPAVHAAAPTTRAMRLQRGSGSNGGNEYGGDANSDDGAGDDSTPSPRSRASSRAGRAEPPGSPRGRASSRNSRSSNSHGSRSRSPESTQARLSVVEVGDDDATLHVSPMPKPAAAAAAAALSRGPKEGSRLARNLWDHDGDEAVEPSATATAGRENNSMSMLQSTNHDDDAAPTPSSSATVVRSAEEVRKDQFRKEMEGRMEAKRVTKSKLGVLLANREIANTSSNSNGETKPAQDYHPVPTKLEFAAPKSASTAPTSLPSGDNRVANPATDGGRALTGAQRSSDLDFLLRRVSTGAGPNLV